VWVWVYASVCVGVRVCVNDARNNNDAAHRSLHKYATLACNYMCAATRVPINQLRENSAKPALIFNC